MWRWNRQDLVKEELRGWDRASHREHTHGAKPGREAWGSGERPQLPLGQMETEGPERLNELPGKHSHCRADSAGMPTDDSALGKGTPATETHRILGFPVTGDALSNVSLGEPRLTYDTRTHFRARSFVNACALCATTASQGGDYLTRTQFPGPPAPGNHGPTSIPIVGLF